MDFIQGTVNKEQENLLLEFLNFLIIIKILIPLNTLEFQISY